MTSARPWTSGHSLFTHQDRKSTRLNSSHGYISYAVFCLKKKKTLSHNFDISIQKVAILHVHFNDTSRAEVLSSQLELVDYAVADLSSPLDDCCGLIDI